MEYLSIHADKHANFSNPSHNFLIFLHPLISILLLQPMSDNPVSINIFAIFDRYNNFSKFINMIFLVVMELVVGEKRVFVEEES